MAGGLNIGNLVSVLEVQDKSAEGLASGRKAMELIAQELRNLKSSYDANAISMREYSNRVAMLTSQQQQLAAAMHQAYDVAGKAGNPLDVLNKQLSGVGVGTNAAGRNMLAFSRIADDMQYVFQNGQGLQALTKLHFFTGRHGAVCGSK